MDNSGSDEFKSYGGNSDTDVNLMEDPLKRPTRPVEQRLFSLYQANVERKRQLLQRINQIELVNQKKVIAKQQQLDKHRQTALLEIVDSDEQFEPPGEFATLKKDFQQKKKQMEALEANYAQCQKVSARMYVELQLNQKAIRELLRSTTEVSSYLYLEKRKIIAVLLTRKGATASTILFRSIGVPTSRHQPVKLQAVGQKLFQNGKYLMVTTQDCRFHIYDIELQKMVVASSVHESPVEYVQLHKTDTDPDWSAVSVSKEGVVRLFDLSKKRLKSVMICEPGTCYHLHEDLLIFGAEGKLRSLNILTKQYKDVFALPEPIVRLSGRTLSTKDYHLNGYINKGQIKATERSAFESIDVNGQPAQLSFNGKDHVLVYKAKEHLIEGAYQFIGTFLRVLDETETATQLIALWGDRRGQLLEVILEQTLLGI